jgi:multimeric flavodoxin WrbA
MKKITIINGSPRGEQSGSQMFIKEIKKLLNTDELNISEICIKDKNIKGETEATFKEILSSDSLLFVFPLYVDCLPSILLDFMEKLEEYVKINKEGHCPKVYAVVNCGFLEGKQNINAIHIVENFANRIGFKWRFGIGIGAGEFMKSTENNIPMQSKLKVKIYNALVELAEDIKSDKNEIRSNLFVSPSIPRFLFLLSGNQFWVSKAKSNNLSKKKLYERPVGIR